MNNIFWSFKEYAINNKSILYFCFFVGIILYGIRIFSYSIGIDSDVYMQNPTDFIYEWNLKEGRFGLTIIQLLLFCDSGLNAYAQNVISMLFLILSCFIWCYILEKNNQDNKIGVYAFILCYLSSVVWLEIFYFTFMAAACAVGIVLTPILLMIWDYAYKTRNVVCLIATIFGIAFIISIYQLLITLFCAGALIMMQQFFFKNCSSSELKSRFFSLIIVTASALVVYYIEYKLCCYIFSVELDSYVANMAFSASSLGEYVKKLCFLAYSILLGDKSILYVINENLHFIKQENIGIIEECSFRGSFAVFIAFILYTLKTGKIFSSNFNLIFLLVSVGIIISLFIVGMVGNGFVPDRYLHAVPLVTSYLLFYSFFVIKNKRTKVLWSIICFYSLFTHCINICYLNNSDIKRFHDEQNFCNTLYTRITDVYYEDNNNSDTIPTVLILGKYDVLDRKNSVRSSIVAQSASMFGNKVSKIESTLRTVPFLNALGYKIEGIKENDVRLDDLKNIAKDMSIYPSKGSIKLINNVVLVKLSSD